MKNEPIICSGNDLARVCADIRSCGGVVESLDASVGGNGGWRVSYFDGGKTIAPKTPSGAEDSAQTNGGEAQRTHLQDCTAVISISPHQGETQAIPAAPEAVKSAVVPRNPFNGPKIPCHGPAGAVLTHASVAPVLHSAETVGVELSIEDRMAALQARLASSGKLQRNKPTQSREARLPHND